jgi:hypothetical protein
MKYFSINNTGVGGAGRVRVAGAVESPSRRSLRLLLVRRNFIGELVHFHRKKS